MNFSIERNYILNSLKVVEKASQIRGIQPVLSNILIEAYEENKLRLSATDLDIAIITTTIANIEREGRITLPAKKLSEIIGKMPDKSIVFDLDEQTNTTTISCGKTKFELIGISASEFPDISNQLSSQEAVEVKMQTQPFIEGIKHTVFAAASYENRNIISGVFFNINENKLEMAATDGNRLTRYIQQLDKSYDKIIKIVIPSKVVQEFYRIISISEEKSVIIQTDGVRIIFKTESFVLTARLLEGEYPPYQQLIPKECAKYGIVGTQELIESLERVSTMVNEKTSIVKFRFEGNQLCMSAKTVDTGASEDIVECEYTQGDELTIAFNYKYILESLKTMESSKVEFGLNSSLSATLLRPRKEEKEECSDESIVDNSDYLCLIMPIQIRE